MSTQTEQEQVPADWQEREQRLLAEMDREFPPAWIPENAGEAIVGVLVEVNPGAYTAMGPCPVVTLQGPNGGQRSVWLWHKVLRGKFARADVHLGETVAIRYDGKVEPKGGGQEYHDYSLTVDRPGGNTGEPDWRSIADRYGDDVPQPSTNSPDAPLSADVLPPGSSQDADDIPF